MSRPRPSAPAIVRLKMLAAACTLLLAACSPPPGSDPLVEPALSWVRQFGGGSEGVPNGRRVAVDSVGNSFVVGSVLAKFGPDGAQQWLHDLPRFSPGLGVASDESGGAYFAGRAGDGSGDSWLEKRDALGNEAWRVTLTNPDNLVIARGVAVTPTGDVVVAGSWLMGPSQGENPVAFLATYGATGVEKSFRLLPFSFDGEWTNDAWDVVVDALGNVYVAGSAYRRESTDGGALRYAYVAKYGSNGDEVWTRRFSGVVSSVLAYGVAANASADRVCVTGSVRGTLDGEESVGPRDAFVVCYDTSGTRLWMRQFGTEEEDGGEGIAMDGAGNVFVAGTTEGTFGTSLGGLLGGGTDAFLARYDRQGVQTHVWEFGTLEADRGYGVAADGAGNVYVTGFTFGSMWIGPVPGAFLVKLEGF